MTYMVGFSSSFTECEINKTCDQIAKDESLERMLGEVVKEGPGVMCPVLAKKLFPALATRNDLN